MLAPGLSSPSLAARRAPCSGQVAVMVAILALLVVALVGLAIDECFVAKAHFELQRAADAGALAAVRQLESEIGLGNGFAQSRQAAIDFVRANEAAGKAVELEANLGNDPGGDIVVGYWDAPTRSFVPDTDNPNAVRVRVRRSSGSSGGPLSLVFGPAFGTKGVDVGVTATAIAGGPASPVVLVLDPFGAGALHLNGTALLDAIHGLVQVNSNNHCAVEMAGTALVQASKLATAGGICADPGNIAGTTQPGAPVCADPLCTTLPDGPSWSSLAGSLELPLGPQGAISVSGAYEPGRYPGGIALGAQASVTLEPGVYLLGPPGLQINGGATLVGEHVTLLVDAGGVVDIGGHASASWTAPVAGPLAGVGLFVHRLTTGLAATLGGDGTLSIGGTVYVPSGTLRLAGGPQKTVGCLVVHRLEDSGTPSLTVLGPAPDQPEPSTYLVE